MIHRDKLEAVLRTLPRLTIGLVGDLFLDRYLHLVPGSRELSVETGQEAYQIDRVRNAPGALGTVLNNLTALGAGLLVPVTAIGDDGHGYDLLKEVRKLPVDPAHVLCLPDRLTPTYTKPLRLEGDCWRELNRLDVRTRAPLSSAATAEVCRRVELVFRTSDGLIVLDQIVDEDCGVVSTAVRQTLERLAREDEGKLIFVDSRRFLGRFAAGTLKGNRGEVGGSRESGVGSRGSGDGRRETGDGGRETDVAAPLAALAGKTGRAAFCTLGERGILVARPNGEPAWKGSGVFGGGESSLVEGRVPPKTPDPLVAEEPVLVPGVPVSGPIDIVGAGDAATSGIVAALLAGADELEAAALGNLVASITIQQLGTTGTATPQQVLDRYDERRA